MPVNKVKGGYKYGKTGKTYSKKKNAVQQGKAIHMSKARQRGRGR
jgi:hypothetical protein